MFLRFFGGFYTLEDSHFAPENRMVWFRWFSFSNWVYSQVNHVNLPGCRGFFVIFWCWVVVWFGVFLWNFTTKNTVPKSRVQLSLKSQLGGFLTKTSSFWQKARSTELWTFTNKKCGGCESTDEPKNDLEFWNGEVHTRKLSWNLKINGWKMRFPSGARPIFRGFVLVLWIMSHHDPLITP